jgi:putative ABC transport system permease protein
VRLYRLLLGLFPRAFRARFGDDMAEVFADRRRAAARAGWPAVAALWARTALDVAHHSAAERRRAHRATARTTMGSDFLGDVREALRGWRDRPGPTVVALLTLALGIGANTAIFSAVNTFFLKPLPYPDEQHLVSLYGSNVSAQFLRSVESAADVQYWRDHSTTVASLAAMTGGSATVTGLGDPVSMRYATVMPTFFDVVGVHPALGRGFTAEETRSDGHVVVISHGLWVDRMGSRPDVVGTTIRLDATDWRVVGVMPAGFSLPLTVEMWRPFDLAKALPRMFYLSTIARLRPDATVAAARHDFDRMAAELAAASPKARKDRGFTVVSLRDDLAWNVSDGLKLLQGVVVLVLLIACANVANLMLAQAAARAREFGVRSALGATPARLIRQVLTESLVLATGAAVLGVALAFWGVQLLVALAPATLLRPGTPIDVSWTVLAFTLSVSVVTGFVFGLAPAMLSSGPSTTEHLRHGVRTTSVGLSWTRRQRLRAGLVVVETALATVLLAGGGLLVRSFSLLMSQSPTIRTDHLMTAQISLPDARYSSVAARVDFWSTLLAKLESLPAAESAVATNALPYSNWEWQTSFQLRGKTGTAGSAGIRQVAGRDYFQTLGIPLLKGRSLAPTDSAGSAPVMVVSDVFARQVFPGTDAIGQVLTLDQGKTWQTIVGVVAAARNNGLNEDPRAEMYVPLAQTDVPATLLLAVRTSTDPAAFAGLIRSAAGSIDRDLPVQSLRTMDELIGRTVADRRFFMALLGAFAGLAAVLAAVGVYGVMSFLVGQGRREIGIRLALGARPIQVQAGLVGRALRVVCVGLGIGLTASWWLTTLLATQLFDTTAHDPLTLAGAFVLLGGAAMLASWIPSRRSSHVDPAIVLRAD